MVRKSLKRRVAGVIGLVFACMGMTGCCDEVCEASDALKMWVAQQYGFCCQDQDGDWGVCLGEIQDKYNELFDLLLQAKLACREGNRELMRSLLKQFFGIVHPASVVDGVYGLVHGELNPNTRVAVRNAHPVLKPWDSIEIQMTSLPPANSVVPTALVRVGNESFLQSAETFAVGITTVQTGVAPVVEYPDPEDQVAQESRYLFSGGTVGVSVGAGTQTCSIRSAQLRIGEILDNWGSRHIPTRFDMSLRCLGFTARMTLDSECPYNEVFYTGSDTGLLRMGVKVAGNAPALDRLVILGTVWVELPFLIHPDGRIEITTGGLVSGTEVLPITESITSDILALASGSNVWIGGADDDVDDDDALPLPPPLPNNEAEACADSNQNGIRDGADEIIFHISVHEQNDCED